MNIQQTLDRMHPADEVVAEAPRSILVAPNPTELPNDGLLHYVVYTNVYDLKSLPDACVLLVSPDKFAEMGVVAANQAMFGLKLSALVGLPAAEYSTVFDQTFWQLEKASYSPLLSEITLAIEQDRQARAANRSVHDAERAQYTRANGTVKAQTDFDVSGDDDA